MTVGIRLNRGVNSVCDSTIGRPPRQASTRERLTTMSPAAIVSTGQRIDRLDHVVVRAGVEPPHLIERLAQPGEHQNWYHHTVRPHLAQHPQGRRTIVHRMYFMFERASRSTRARRT